MRRRTLFLQLFPVYSLITLAALLALGLYFVSMLQGIYQAQATDSLEVCARLAGAQLERETLLRSHGDLAKIVRSLSKKCRARLTVVSPSGTVLADSQKDPRRMENHADRPEIRKALSGGVGNSLHRSPTLGMVMIYVAVPITQGGKITGVVRASRPVGVVNAVAAAAHRPILLAVLATAAAAGLASLVAAKLISAPISRLRETAARMAAGDLTARAPASGIAEFANLGETLNGMAERLDQLVRASSEMGRELQAILSSMREGVVAINGDDRILILNPTAEELLDAPRDRAIGKTVPEVIRHPGLLRFFETCRTTETPIVEEITLRGRSPGGAQDRTLLATGTALVDNAGKKIGALVVLNDITQTRKLENMRREFVANVSHELKTPITSIKGFVETILESGLEDRGKTKEFLEIVARQADRINSIIEDLLALSAIEQKAEAAEVTREPTAIEDVLRQAAAALQAKAQSANVRIEIECPASLSASVNALLLEQAITNLLDNAVKYSPSGGTVKLIAESTGDELAIHVVDNGPGIEAEHIPRLFERFYRVDKARSRKLGGTGLGLAIVKHIVQAHNGRTEVQSAPGKGSTFSIFIPAGSESG